MAQWFQQNNHTSVLASVDSDAVPCAASRRAGAPRAVTLCDAVRCYAVRRDIVQLGPTPHPDTLSRAIVLAGDVPHGADRDLRQRGGGGYRGCRGCAPWFVLCLFC